MIKVVLFDVDGCLIDSAEANWRQINLTNKKYGGRQIAFEEYKKRFYSRTLKEVLGECCPNLSEKELLEAVDYGISLSSELYRYIKLTEGVQELLEKLRGRFRMGVVSSRLGFGILDGLKISSFFEHMIGYHDSENHKPHPEPLLVAMKRFGVKPEETVYVGDQWTDAEAAKKAGLKSIILGDEAIGDYNITDFMEILDILKSL